MKRFKNTQLQKIVGFFLAGSLFISCSQDNEVAEEPMDSAEVEQVSPAQSAPSTTTSSNTTTSQEKDKKMSNTAKGALIGAGAGAITGAAVSKKKGKGAIVGGIIGAGAGAITGKVIDKKKENDDNQ